MNPSSSDSTQLQIKFLTKQEQYSVPDTPFAVPSSVSITELNTLIHELLKESKDDELKRQVEFDFIVAGEFLRSSLGDHISTRNISSEIVLDVEYLERLPAPQPKDCLVHDDWVSSVQVHNNWILSGCYDSTLHLWTLKGKHKLTIPGHTSCVKAVAWISSTDNITTFVSGSHDQTALLWEWNVDQNVVECVHVCKGHSRSIECIGVNTDATKFATGSYDTFLKIWSTSLEECNQEGEIEDDEEREIKRAKKEIYKKSQLRTPLMTLQGHKETVSGLSWMSQKDLVTCSMDHTLRIWDIESGVSKKEIMGNKSFFDVHSSPVSGLLLTASSDRHVRLYDPKSNEGMVVKASFSSHTLWVQSVRWSPANEYLFISGAYDKQVKLWDIRSPQVPLYELSGHNDKVLCCDWTDPSLMVSGGADNTIRIFKSKNY